MVVLTPDRPTPESCEGSLAEHVYRAISEDVLSARIGRDELFLEQALAERYGVSKTPVREALRLFAHEGLLLGAAAQGIGGWPVGIQDVVEVFELRRILEPHCARRRLGGGRPSSWPGMEESVEIERQLVDPGLEEMEKSGSASADRRVDGNDRAIAVVRSLMETRRGCRGRSPS